MPGEIRPLWKFTDDDRARLQPLLDKMVMRANYAAARVCELADTIEDRLLLLQGACESIAEWMREQVLEQIDRGEWALRGICRREDVSITVCVDAEAAYHDPTANLIHLSILPTECLS